MTINIGKTATVVQANAVQVVPGPDGVVTLPAGVELSDIHVVGSDLVVDLPDGTQMVIVDGAVFVPQIVLGTIEIPASNLAALLIDSEPTPAAGPPQSSGGNFAVPVAPLDPGAPLGDLIPPTELDYTPPEFNDVTNAIEDDELPLITDLVPSVSGGDVTVDEDDLPAGSDTTKESLTVWRHLHHFGAGRRRKPDCRQPRCDRQRRVPGRSAGHALGQHADDHRL